MLVLRGISYPPSWGFEGTDLAVAFLFPFWGFLRNPHSLPRASCANPFTHVLAQASLDEVGEWDFYVIPTVCHGHPVQILLLTSSLKQAWTRPFVKVFCGERGIRTPETLLEFTRFPGVPLQPLEHLSFALASSNLATLSGTIHLTTRKGTKNI